MCVAHGGFAIACACAFAFAFAFAGLNRWPHFKLRMSPVNNVSRLMRCGRGEREY